MKQFLSNVIEKLYGEKTIYCLVGFGLLGAMVEFYLYIKIFSLSDRFWFGFLANILFLNLLHSIITYRLLSFRQFKEALTRGMKGKLWRLIALGLFLFTTLFVHFYVFFNQIQLSPFWNSVNVLFLFFYAGYLRTQHTAYQAYGILQNYNEKERIQSSLEKFFESEKMVFNLFFAGCVVYSFGFFARGVKFDLRADLLQMVGGLFALCIALLIVLKSISTHGLHHKRTQFSWRFVLMPLKYNSLAAAFCNISCHGVEYFWLTQRIKSNLTKQGHKAEKVSKFMLVFLAIGIFCYFLEDYVSSNYTKSTPLASIPVVFIVTVTQVVSILHFIIDRYYFRFKDPTTLQEISQLMKAEDKALEEQVSKIS